MNSTPNDRRKMRVTFEWRNNERATLCRVDDDCLAIYANRICYKEKIMFWRDMVGCQCMPNQEKCRTYAGVPLEPNDKIAICNAHIGPGVTDDHIHFWITQGKLTSGHLFVSSAGVAWVEKNCKNAKVKTWREFGAMMMS